jgi:hypothetical protein
LGDEAADDIRTCRALEHKPALGGFAETRYQAKSWNKDRRVCARIEPTTEGLDIRFVITSIHTGSAEHVYEALDWARGQAEDLIKLHQAQFASDRPWRARVSPGSHRALSGSASRQRCAGSGASDWPAGCGSETASGVRLVFAAACPEAALFRHIAAALMPSGP